MGVSEAATGQPRGVLQRHVASYQTYRERDVEPGQHLGVPSPYLTVIFTLEEPVVIARRVDPREIPGTYTSIFGGLHTAPALVVDHGAQLGFSCRWLGRSGGVNGTWAPGSSRTSGWDPKRQPA